MFLKSESEIIKEDGCINYGFPALSYNIPMKHESDQDYEGYFDDPTEPVKRDEDDYK